MIPHSRLGVVFDTKFIVSHMWGDNYPISSPSCFVHDEVLLLIERVILRLELDRNFEKKKILHAR